jgi:zinc protease
VSSFVLENGLTVHVVPSDNLPLVAAQVVIGGGAGSTALRAPGLAHLVGELIDDGAGARGAIDIAQQLELLGMSLSVKTALDHTSVTVDGLAASLPGALDLLADLVQRPRFDEQEVARARDNEIARLERNAFDGYEVALATARQVVFGPGHPYSFAPSGTRKALKGFTRRQIVAHHRAWWTPSNAAVIVVGKVTAEGARSLLEPRFGGWRGDGARPKQRNAPIGAPPSRRRVLVVDMPRAPQTVLMAAAPGLTPRSPDWAAVDVMNRVVGGTYASRLNMRLREEKGYTYAARSFVDRSRLPGIIYASASVDLEETGPALQDFLAILGAAGTQMPSADEMEQARASARARLIQELETTAKTSDALASLLAFGLPFDWHGQASSDAMKVGPADALAAGRRYLRPEDLTIVLVGPADRIGPALAKLGLGEPERVAFTAF